MSLLIPKLRHAPVSHESNTEGHCTSQGPREQSRSGRHTRTQASSRDWPVGVWRVLDPLGRRAEGWQGASGSRG